MSYIGEFQEQLKDLTEKEPGKDEVVALNLLEKIFSFLFCRLCYPN